MSKVNDQALHNDEAENTESGLSKNPEADTARHADADTMKKVAGANRDAIKKHDTVGGFLAYRDGMAPPQSPLEIVGEVAPTPKVVARLKGGEIRRVGDAAAGSLPDAEFEKQRVRFWNENGVEVTKNAGKYEYRMHRHKETLCISDATAKGIEEAHKKIEAVRQEKMAELGKTYGATFSKDGETAGKQAVYDKAMGAFVVGTDDVQCRAPKLHELLGIEAALKVSQPSAQGVKFYLMTNQLFKNVTEMADCHGVPQGGSDKSAKPGSPAIFLNARLTLDYPSTESAAKNWKGQDRSGSSLEQTLAHELVHHSETVMKWDTPMGKSAVSFGMNISGQMGWTSLKPPTRETNKWLLEDKNGNYWKHENVTGDFWVRMKTNGSPINEKGLPCDYKHIHRIRNAEMVEIAKVRPATTYNDTPSEMFAEGMTKFRDGQRQELWKNNRDLYNILKVADQKEINRVYPLDKNHKPTRIRAADGRIVANTQAEQAAIQKLEN